MGREIVFLVVLFVLFSKVFGENGQQNHQQNLFGNMDRTIQIFPFSGVLIVEDFVQIINNGTRQTTFNCPDLEVEIPFDVSSLQISDRLGVIRDVNPALEQKISFKPRYPLCGGWKTSLSLSLSLPLSSFSPAKENNFEIFLPIENLLSNVEIEKYQMKVILPDGITEENIELETGEREREEKEREKERENVKEEEENEEIFPFLGLFPLSVVQINFDSSPKPNSDLILRFFYPFWFSFRLPLALFSLLFGFLSLIILVNQLFFTPKVVKERERDIDHCLRMLQKVILHRITLTKELEEAFEAACTRKREGSYPSLSQKIHLKQEELRLESKKIGSSLDQFGYPFDIQGVHLDSSLLDLEYQQTLNHKFEIESRFGNKNKLSQLEISQKAVENDALFSSFEKAFKTYYDDLLGDVTQIEEKKEKAKKEKREKKDPDAEEEK